MNNLLELNTCSWCDRPDASIRPLMSTEHPACDTCYVIWYDKDPASPEKLRELSLAMRNE